MKRRCIYTAMLSLLLAVSMIIPARATTITTAVRSPQTIYINGRLLDIAAYSIYDNNYVRLRDIAAEIDFGVAFRSEDGTVHISTTESYSGGSSEIGQTPERVEVTQNSLTVHVDGQAVVMTAYNIGGNNYVKLREIGAAVNFGVEWDAVNNRVLIDTSKPYTPETQSTAPPPTASDIPGGTVTDYSLEANPEIFNYFTRDEYNADRQRVLDTGTSVYWGTTLDPKSNAAVDAFNKLLDRLALLSELEKVYCINEFLSAHITYELGATFKADDFWTGMSYGICENYARMFQYICYRSGLLCIYVTGNVDGNRHSWNELYVNEKWQFYDGTLSDSWSRLILSDTAESANTGRIYTLESPRAIMYSKEAYVPLSTLK